MMFRVAGLLLVFVATDVVAGDYLLTIERHETVTINEDSHPKVATSIRRVEVLCRSGVPFLARAVFGPVRMSVAGKFREMTDGRIYAKIRVSHAVETNLGVVTDSGEIEPVAETEKVSTSVAVEPGDSMAISESITRLMDQSSDKPVKTIQETVVMTIAERPPKPREAPKPVRPAGKPARAHFARPPIRPLPASRR